MNQVQTTSVDHPSRIQTYKHAIRKQPTGRAGLLSDWSFINGVVLKTW